MPATRESSEGRSLGARLACLTVLALMSTGAGAHSFVLPYELPVPFSLYLYGCSATLLLTFAVIAYFLTVPSVGSSPALPRSTGTRPLLTLRPPVLRTLRSLAVGGLALTVLAGFIGTRNPDANISMMLFWVVFVLAFPYATPFIGDLYDAINPWKVIAAGLEPATARSPRLHYPSWLGYWPALIFYIGLIWLELFPLPKPNVLAAALVIYSIATLGGVWLFGQAKWFRYGELFSVLFRMIGLLAPFEYRRSSDDKSWGVFARAPLSGILHEAGEHFSLVVFVLFMLSSTTFDGMHETLVWMELYWKHLIVDLQPLWGSDLLASQRLLESWYVVYQRAGLVLSPFIYLVVYLAVIALLKIVSGLTLSVRQLAIRFVFTIVPIAVAYNMAHYWTMLLLKIPRLSYALSDPFGYGWNLLGLTLPAPEPAPLNTGAIWNIEVLLIVAGHLVAVYLAHRIATQLLPSKRQAVVSQLPMLLLMVLYTVIALWVISQPLALEGRG